MRKRQAEAAEHQAALFNEAHPVGTEVRYWPGVREGEGVLSRTRSAAWCVGGMALVLVAGKSGGIALSHVEVVPPGTKLREGLCAIVAEQSGGCDVPPDFTWPDGGHLPAREEA